LALNQVGGHDEPSGTSGPDSDDNVESDKRRASFSGRAWLGGVATQAVHGQTFTVLYSFKGYPDGASPHGALLRDAEGNFYGTTYYGGSSDYGTVFKLSRSGEETVLYSFTWGTDGGSPSSGLVRDKAGNLYGTTEYGGDFTCNVYDGCGTVFKVDSNGTETVVHSFAGGTTDGCYPFGGLIRDKAGNLYGTTQSCGAFGTVFKLDKTGTETLLHSFTGYDGAYPTYTRLLMDMKGSLYGVTSSGGNSEQGVVYVLSQDGTETVLHSFTGAGGDGCNPFGTPTMDKNGILYGTTSACGTSSGIVWKLGRNGAETVLHRFTGSDGAEPIGGVIMDDRGNLYGDTSQGSGTGCGGYGCGTIFKLDASGKETVLHRFTGLDGAHPFRGLIRDMKGNLYGTTAGGGSSGYGMVWKLTP
jgi:uncharacterized repeat protein (TIGR03803 family)